MSNARRATAIVRTILKHRLDTLIPAHDIPLRLVRWPLALLDKCLPAPTAQRGERLRNALTDLGPVFIKLGQLMSTRRDLLPPDVADELSLLQDQVPPALGFDVRQYVQEALGSSPESIFAELDLTPIASASIAQVHAAKLVTGEAVVVKLVKPDVEAHIKNDMALLKRVASLVDDWIPDARRLHLPRVAADHERVLLGELNLFSEAKNQIQLRRNFAESDLLYVPRVFGQFTRQNVLVMERIHGIPIGNVDDLVELGVDLEVLANKGVETFFTQVFEHNYFHADMHPGNIFVDVTNPANPRYIALDCAIIGSLTTEDQSYLAQNLVAFFERDYRRIVTLHLESGWVPAETDAQEFEQVIRQVCEPIFAKPLAEISFGEFVVELFRTAGQFNMEIQPQLVLLQKTLLYIEGVGRQLYPQLDLWETAQPFMRQWVANRFGPAASLREILKEGPEFWTQLLRLPSTLQSNSRNIRELKTDLAQQNRSIERIEQRLSRQHGRRRTKQAVGATCLGLSVWLLWQPLAAGIGSGDMTMLAGVISAFLGSALIVKA